MVVITIGFTMGLLALGILGIIAAGIKSLSQGKQDFKRIAIMAIPVVLFIISYFVFGGDMPRAVVFTAGLMMGAMILAIAFTGLRGTFK